MENSASSALDLNGQPILVGVAVRYLNTGTAGMVQAIRADPEGAWAQIDTTGLFYRTSALLIIDASELKDKTDAKKSVDTSELAQRLSQTGPQNVDIGQVTGGG